MILRRLAILCMIGALFFVALVAWMFMQARAMPVIRTAEVTLPFPADAPRVPIRVAWVTDTHLSGPDNSPERLDRVVDLVNAQHPDLILLGGDYVGQEKLFEIEYPDAAAVKPFRRLHAPMGVVAVLGNHDMSWATRDTSAAIRDGFRAAGIPLLVNQAIRRGPLVIGGIPDLFKGLADVPVTQAAMRRLGGAPVLLSHTADAMTQLGGWHGLVLAGHSHCGQIALPLVGPLYVPAYTGLRYACGRYAEDGKTLIVSGGVGTSGLPLRLMAPPDIWMITIRPAPGNGG